MVGAGLLCCNFLTRISLDCGRTLEHPKETHADTGRMCILHTDSDPCRESNPGPWCCEAAVLTTVPPNSNLNDCEHECNNSDASVG